MSKETRAVRLALVRELRLDSESCKRRALEHPEDRGTVELAEALEQLATFVESLPEDDSRLQRIVETYTRLMRDMDIDCDADFPFLLGLQDSLAHSLVWGFDFYHGSRPTREECDDFLTKFIAEVLQADEEFFGSKARGRPAGPGKAHIPPMHRFPASASRRSRRKLT